KMPANPRLLIDGFSGTSYKLFINGKEVNDKGRRSKLDAEIKEIDVKKYLREGKNLITVKLTANRRTDGLLDLIKIVGDFALKAKGEEYVIAEKPAQLRVGDWTKQGYPQYSGTIFYKHEVYVPENYLDGKLFLEADCGEDVMEVKVNGSESMVAPWRPYRFDVTGKVKAGKNTIEIGVTNTLINMLEAVEHKSGLLKNAKLVYEPKYEFIIK
ncbi:MAG TPA: hypothetical protein VHO28_01810, partial [Ignavibacteriales bacterium]|nr:hypothetical protein [Ignavibacteriales bacterium]